MHQETVRLIRTVGCVFGRRFGNACHRADRKRRDKAPSAILSTVKLENRAQYSRLELRAIYSPAISFNAPCKPIILCEYQVRTLCANTDQMIKTHRVARLI